MSKPVKALLKLQIPGGGATPAPPVGSALGQYKMEDLNANDIDAAINIIAGTARSMGVTVEN